MIAAARLATASAVSDTSAIRDWAIPPKLQLWGQLSDQRWQDETESVDQCQVFSSRRYVLKCRQKKTRLESMPAIYFIPSSNFRIMTVSFTGTSTFRFPRPVRISLGYWFG